MQKLREKKLAVETLKEAGIGLWVIEVEENKAQRLYLNDTALSMLGLEENQFSPEKLFEECLSRIRDDYKETIRPFFRRMLKESFYELQFPWRLGKKSEIILRLGAKQDMTCKKFARYEGAVRNVSKIVGIKKQMEAQREELVKSVNKEFTFYGIAGALLQDFESIYYVNIENGKYKEFIGHGSFKDFKFQTEGNDFFCESVKNIPEAVYIKDRQYVVNFIRRDNIMPSLKARKTISIRYRIVVKGKPVYYRLTAAPSVEEDKKHYIFALQNIDENVKTEKEFHEKIRVATELANTDALTGIKNRLAYERAEEKMNEEISSGKMSPFALAVFDVNNLKKTNDRFGHEAGDELIKKACHLICEAFTHSPVFRIGGDEFVAILMGADFFDREKIISRFHKNAIKNKKAKDAVVASGFADYDFNRDKKVSDVFERGDAKMYENKKKLKKK